MWKSKDEKKYERKSEEESKLQMQFNGLQNSTGDGSGTYEDRIIQNELKN